MSGHQWVEELGAFGWPSTHERLREFCEMLLANGLLHWTQLDLVSEPAALMGADVFTSEELRVLSDVRRRGREVPR